MMNQRNQARDRLAGLGIVLPAMEIANWQPVWTIEKFECPEARRRGLPYDVLEIEGNKLLNEGINALFNLLCGDGGETAFDNSNAYIGVGDGGLTSLTGTVTFTNGSASVTGSGTAFDTEVAADDWVELDADGVLYRVLSVTNATTMTLVHLYDETGGAGAASVFEPDDTGLAAGANKLYKGMEAGYPTYGSSQKATWRSEFGSSEGNFAWNEITVANGNSDSADNLNRLVQSVGTKASPGVWTVTLEVSLN